MTKCFYIIVALAFVLTGCASVLPGKDKAHAQAIKNKVPPGYVKAPRGEPHYRFRSIKLFGSGDSGDSTKLSGPRRMTRIMPSTSNGSAGRNSRPTRNGRHKRNLRLRAPELYDCQGIEAII